MTKLSCFFVGLFLLAGCAFEPTGATPFTPPESYRAVWDSAQACTGRHGEFNKLRFFKIEGRVFDTPEGEAAGWADGTTIYLASHYWLVPMVVKHEMIHALGIKGHPLHPFVDPCHATWASAAAGPALAEAP